MRKKLLRRTKVLELLHKNSADYLSGQELSKQLGVSRTSIWKYINYFKEAGYKIESSSKLGYRLVESADILLPEEIDLGLDTEFMGQNIIQYDEVDSTNQLAKEQAENNAKEGTVVIAEKQVAAKGRVGRKFSSPKGGIWLSCILRPDLKPVLATRATYLSSLALAKTIAELTNLDPKIKWPNDVLLNGAKVSGILTEMGAELDQINYLIVGLGINANIDKKNLPVEVQDRATTLYHELGQKIDRIKFVQYLLKFIEESYRQINDFNALLEEWKKYAYTIGKKVVVSSARNKISGIAIDIAEDGALILEVDGQEKKVYSGDVSLRHQN
ncbi:biotin--[acetyl-CoA-carboxylase] ligase [Halanaerobacter jeridensis]|uniref:Bifunctional ligase/repressor BirA n=1 Tax=Halanaerobacter jeridensis TaxID=706427 RepID=A0A938XUK7_9FIRM|nr:biotin--[acetyl-CoA-carboxylase] ligase [Halanaerobacter jeridensis]MBM7557164.1 BirA family biotin operon repressor/biotin-[acetyl-CoA-carboxylase] ligase [Halanaerobacter jeridensis]